MCVRQITAPELVREAHRQCKILGCDIADLEPTATVHPHFVTLFPAQGNFPAWKTLCYTSDAFHKLAVEIPMWARRSKMHIGINIAQAGRLNDPKVQSQLRTELEEAIAHFKRMRVATAA
jgi:hypothetical protein